MVTNLIATVGEFHNAISYGAIGTFVNNNEYLYAVQYKKSGETYLKTRYFENSQEGYSKAVSFYKELMDKSL